MSSSSASDLAGYIRGNGADRDARIEFADVGLRFRSFGDSLPSLKQTVFRKLSGQSFKEDSYRWLYRGLGLTIEHGCRLGVVGPNGAGKSTLLKMICGIYRPTTGTIRVRGQIAPLIELGAGMVAELSGEENIYLNGALMGYSRREMRAKIERIFDFAGLQGFRKVPIKYYSSGMMLRLAFSTASDLNPEILLIDEIFAAGDAEFVRRARARMESLIDASHIVVIVSHQLELIKQMCNRVIHIENGHVVDDGNPAEVIARYLAGVQAQTEPVRLGT